MKTQIQIKMENGFNDTYTKTIIANRHKIKLITGETINVCTDKRGNQWFVTDVESGLLLVPSAYYGFLCYDPKHDVYKERNAIQTAKYCIDEYLKSKNTTFKQMRENRIKNIKEYD